MARKTTMADIALRIISERGPVSIPDLKDALVAAGATKARDPLQTTEALVHRDERLITGSDGRVFSVLRQLEGACLSHRVNSFEVARDVLVLAEADWLIQVATAGGCRLTSGATLRVAHMYQLFDIPWDEDGYDAPRRSNDLSNEDAVWDYIAQNSWSSALSGPTGWLPDMQANDLIALRPLNGSFELVQIGRDEVKADDVSSAIEMLRRLADRTDPHAGDGPAARNTQDLLALVAIEAPQILQVTLPPLGELLAEVSATFRYDAGDQVPLAEVTDLWRLNDTDHYNDQMSTKMTATQVKARLLSLLDRVAAGEEVEITKHGRSVARLVPAAGPHALRASLSGVAMTADPNDDLLGTGETWNAA